MTVFFMLAVGWGRPAQTKEQFKVLNFQDLKDNFSEQGDSDL